MKSQHHSYFNCLVNMSQFNHIAILFFVFCFSFFTQMIFDNPTFSQQSVLLPSESHVETDSLYREMLSSVEAAVSISARIRQQTTLFGQEFIASGAYNELKTQELRGRKDATRFRLELQIQSPAGASNTDSPNSLTISRDSTYQYIYRYTSIEGIKRLERIDIKRLMEAIEKQGGYTGPIEVASMFGLGGLAGMLRSIRNQYDFSYAPVMTQINEKNGSIAVWKIRGRLKPAAIAALTVDANGNSQAIPKHTPTAIDIYIGVDDRFPFRFDYFWTADGSDNGGENFGYLMFYDRVLHDDRNIPETIFDYQPSENILPDDVTNSVIQRMLR